MRPDRQQTQVSGLQTSHLVVLGFVATFVLGLFINALKQQWQPDKWNAAVPVSAQPKRPSADSVPAPALSSAKQSAQRP